jgi:hypothetical protein
MTARGQPDMRIQGLEMTGWWFNKRDVSGE